MLRVGISGATENSESNDLRKTGPGKNGPANSGDHSSLFGEDTNAGEGGLYDGGPSPVALARMVEGEIIPRLLLAHGSTAIRPISQQHGAPCNALAITPGCIERFARDALGQDAFRLLAHSRALLVEGLTIEALLVDLFAPAARMLGEWWENDVCDFVDVTMGLWRLQEVLHEIGAQSPADHAQGEGMPGAFFALMPGDIHGFGTLMLEEVFRQAGWRTSCHCNRSKSELKAEVAANWYDIIGLTVCVGEHMPDVADMVAALRASSRNPEAVLMVGGFVFNADPKLVGSVGADATAADARAAVRIAESLLEERARRRPLRQAGRM
jgi:methanogenic corrinoid protein MtbC1